MSLSLGAGRTGLMDKIFMLKVFHDLHFALTHTELSIHVTALADLQITTSVIQHRQNELLRTYNCILLL